MKRSNLPPRKTALKRTSLKKKRRKTSPAMKQARRLALERAEGLCEARWTGCFGVAGHAHHLRRRSQGGADNVDNLLMVCPPCHSAIHANPSLAVKKGHLKMGKNDQS